MPFCYTLAMQILYYPAAIYIALMLVMFLFQRQLIYFPARDLQAPEHYGYKGARLVEIYTADNEIIHGWHKAGEAGMPTVIYFHGNTGHLGDRALKLQALSDKGYSVLGISWRGYGTSSGRPSEPGLLEDAVSSVKFLLNEGVREDDIILFGESLGTGPAVYAGGIYHLKLVMLEAPYTSIRQRGQEKYPWLPVRFLLRDEFDSLSRVKVIKSPVLVLHGALDDIIPAVHGTKLFDAAPEPKRMVLFPDVHHSDFTMDSIIREMELSLALLSQTPPNSLSGSASPVVQGKL